MVIMIRKLTKLQVSTIRLLYKRGTRQKELAIMFDVHKSTISRIVNKKRRLD